ncbi:hypothetical protein EI94DRAFT_1727789 [Lactarius quietus]|nr:hypothetical protein EI94DRAFT_1727789 [Lactarius quietus]
MAHSSTRLLLYGGIFLSTIPIASTAYTNLVTRDAGGASRVRKQFEPTVSPVRDAGDSVLRAANKVLSDPYAALKAPAAAVAPQLLVLR